MVSSSGIKSKSGGGGGANRRIGGGVFKRTIQQITQKIPKNGLTNRPEFHSKSLNQTQPRKQNHHEKNIPQTGARLVIKNLDFMVKSEDLEELFNTFGKITKCVILRHRDGKSLGMCHIDFNEEKAGLEATQEYNGLPLDGREMHITCLKGAEIHEKTRAEAAEMEEMRKSFGKMNSDRRSRSPRPRSDRGHRRSHTPPRRRRSRSPPRYDNYSRNQTERSNRRRSRDRYNNRHKSSSSRSSADSDDRSYRRRRRSSDRRR